MSRKECIIRFFLILTLAVLFGMWITYCAPQWTHVNAPPTPSYQGKNLAVLKMTKRDDVLICVVENGTSRPTIQRALLVENSNADRIVAYSLNQRFVGGVRIYDYLMFDACEIRILRPSETRGASDMLADIILYGLNPPAK